MKVYHNLLTSYILWVQGSVDDIKPYKRGFSLWDKNSLPMYQSRLLCDSNVLDLGLASIIVFCDIVRS